MSRLHIAVVYSGFLARGKPKGSTPLSTAGERRETLWTATKKARKKMSYRLVHDALHTDGCKGLTKFVLVALADYANDETGECYPAQGTIAKIVGCSRRAVLKAIKDLESCGYITRTDKHGLTRQYKVTIPTCEHSSHNGVKSNCVNMVHTMPKSDCVNMVHTIEPAKPVNEVHIPVNVVHTPVNQVHTNREYNREVNREVNNTQDKTDIKAKVIEPIKSNNSNVCLSSGDVINLSDIGLAAKERLLATYSDDEAMSKIKAVSEEFRAKARELKAAGYPGISNKYGYLVGMLVKMAKEGPKQQATPTANDDGKREPRDLISILGEIAKLLKAEHNLLPAIKIDSLLDYREISTKLSLIWSDLAEKETVDWDGNPAPLSYCRKRLNTYIDRELTRIIIATKEDLDAKRRSICRNLATAERTIGEIEDARRQNGHDPVPPKEDVMYWSAKSVVESTPAKLMAIDNALNEYTSRYSVAA